MAAITRLCFVSFACFSFSLFARTAPRAAVRRAPAMPRICAACIRAHENFLASDALNGRGSATHDELVAATYIAAQLEQYGVEPIGDGGGYLQKVALERRKPAAAPRFRREPSCCSCPRRVAGSASRRFRRLRMPEQA